MTGLTIIIVNYNSAFYLKQCLASIYRNQTPFPYIVYVVDNASSDNLGKIQSAFPAACFIKNTENCGYARANNIILSQNLSPYVLLLNPDVVLPDNALAEMVQFMNKHPDAAMVGPKLVRPNGHMDLACRRSVPTPLSGFFKLSGLSRLFPRSRLFARYNLTFQSPDETAEVDAICGACMMIRRMVLNQIGVLDERFFLYGEDLDLAYRARQMAWKIYFLPKVTAVHYKGASTSTNQLRSCWEFHQAMLIFYRKHYDDKYPAWLKAALYCGVYGRYGVSFMLTIVRLAAECCCRGLAFESRR